MPFGATESLGKAVLKGMTTPERAGQRRALPAADRPGRRGQPRSTPSTRPPTFTLWSQIVAFELLHKALAQGVATIPASSGGDEPGFMAVGFDPRTSRDFVISNNEGIGWGAGREP